MADWDALFVSAALRSADRRCFKGLRPEHMDEEWAAVLTYIREFAQRYTDLPSVAVFEEEFPSLELPIPDAPANYYRDKIVTRAQCAMLSERLGSVAESLEETNADDALTKLKVAVSDAYREFQVGSSDQSINYAEDAPSRLEGYLYRKEFGGILGIETPWPTLTTATSGWQAGDFIVFVAKSGVGKTFLGVKAAVDAMLKGYNVLFCSQEMSPQQISFRFDGVGSRLNSKAIADAILHEDQEQQYFEWLDRLERSYKAQEAGEELEGEQRIGRSYVLGPGDVSSILDVDAAIDLYQPDLVVWDSFYAVASSKHEDQADLAKDIKRVASRRGVPLIGITQLNAGAEEGSGSINQNHMAFSKRIYKEADFVLAIWQPNEARNAKEMYGKSLKVRQNEPIERVVFYWDHTTSNFDEKSDGGVSGAAKVEGLNDEVGFDFFGNTRKKNKKESDDLMEAAEPFDDDDLTEDEFDDIDFEEN